MDELTELGIGAGILTMILTALPFLAIALGLVWLALRSRRRTTAVQAWPEIIGKILHSEVEMKRSSNGHGGISTAYYPKVVYEYEVAGQRYQSQQIQAGYAIGLGSESAVQNQIAQYPPGTMIRVFYDPANPTQAVLDKTGSPATTIFSGVAVFIVLTLCATLGITAAAMYFVFRLIGSFDFGA